MAHNRNQRWLWRLITLAALSVALWQPVVVRAQAPGSDGSQRYIVTFRTGTSQNDRASSARRAGVQLRYNFALTDSIAVTIPNVNALAALQQDISVLTIIPDREMTAFAKPGSDGGTVPPAQVVPANITRVDPNGNWDKGSDGTGIGVVILDTGLDFNHTDLVPETNVRFSAHDNNCQDVHGHGTHVAGTVAARNNAQGVVGIAPKAKIYCGKVLNNSGSGSDSDIMAGLEWVFNNREAQNIRVVNMSLGRTGALNDNPPLRATFAALYNAGVAVVVSAGNDASREVKDMIPAGYPEVLAVASTTALEGSNAGCRAFTSTIQADTASYFTTDGKLSATNIGVTISAPGEEKESISKACFIQSTGILSLKVGGGTTRMSGTSMSSPLVAGIVARMMQKGVTTNAGGVDGIRTTLRGTAQNKPAAPYNSPVSSYSYDGEREGVALAPLP